MKIAITGESGFIGRNLPKSIEKFGHEFVSLNEYKNFLIRRPRTDEPCVYNNSEQTWIRAFYDLDIDVVIHNAAVVGTDVVALNSTDSTLSNVAGTHNIVRAANACDVGVCYVGTTVIYDTANYQEQEIVERSTRKPTTLYGCQKVSAEDIIKGMCEKWSIVRPLFAFGGIGDMNSLIAKGLYSALNNKTNIKMFLDPAKIKDYLFVEDFCDGVMSIIDSNIWQDDFNIAAETPYVTKDIVNIMQEISGLNMQDVFDWQPQTDYLGNHRLSSRKIRNQTNWQPKYTLRDGIQEVWNSFNTNLADGYNPLHHLESAKEKGFNLESHFPKV
tara:strand:+ start:8714 stop:9700 length:987 start_codon:yes stop_codon:yes gene_type:complete